jgi:hypothetical protein
MMSNYCRKCLRRWMVEARTFFCYCAGEGDMVELDLDGES